MRRILSRSLVVSAVLAILGSATRARADDFADEADLQFQLAAEAYGKGEFREALVHFLASNRLVPNRNVSFNVARSYEQLKQYPEAFRYYSQALEGETDAGVRARVQTALDKIKPFVAVVRVVTNPPGATVYIDRRDLGPRGVSPRALGLAAGRYKIIAGFPGYFPAESVEIDASVAGESTITLELSPKLEGQTGNLVVNADEPGALIEIDGKPRAFTPAIVTLPVGPHRLRVTLKGFRTIEREVKLAQNEETRLDFELTQADEVTAASRITELVDDAPSSVSIVRSQELRGMQYPTIAEAVRGLPGVFVSDDRSYATVGFRGLARLGDYGNRVLVLLDGQPTNDNWIGSSYVGYDARTDLADIERIEVVRGPGSVLYGTNAFSGVINLVTRGVEHGTSREVGLSTAEYGVARARARLDVQEGGLSVWTSVAAAKGFGRDHYFPEYAGSAPGVDGHARNLDGFQSATLNGRATYGKLTALWFLTSRNKGVPTAEFDTLFGDSRFHQIDTRGLVEARFEPDASEHVQTMSRVHLNYYTFRGQYPRAPDDGGVERDKYDGSWAGLEERIAWSPTEGVRLTAGGEAQVHYQVHQQAANAAGTILDQSSPYQVLAGYLLADVAATSWARFSGGARVDHYSTFGSSVNPRLAAVFHPYEAGHLKVLAGKAFRAPSVYELYYNDGNLTQKQSPGLRPESIYSGEVELTHRFTPTVSGTIGSYGNLVRDLIVTRGTGDPGDLLHYENAGAPVLTIGGDVGIRREWRQGWMLEASYSFQRSRYLRSAQLGDVVAGRNDVSLRGVPNAPEHLASIRGAVPILSHAVLATTRISFEAGRLDRHDEVSDPVAQNRTDPAVIWDLVFSREETRWGLRYSLGVYNAFDWRYALPVGSEFKQNTIVQNGRTFLGSADLTF